MFQILLHDCRFLSWANLTVLSNLCQTDPCCPGIKNFHSLLNIFAYVIQCRVTIRVLLQYILFNFDLFMLLLFIRPIGLCRQAWLVIICLSWSRTLLTCYLEHFQHDTSSPKCCHFWRRQGSTDRRRLTTGPSPTYRQSPRFWRGWCRHVCDLTWWALQTLASSSPPTDRVTALRPLCSMS